MHGWGSEWKVCVEPAFVCVVHLDEYLYFSLRDVAIALRLLPGVRLSSWHRTALVPMIVPSPHRFDIVSTSIVSVEPLVYSTAWSACHLQLGPRSTGPIVPRLR
jgi:hypothetical protein